MKTVIVAVLVLLVVGQSEALKCLCGGLRQCSSSVETCIAPADACGSVLFYGLPTPKYFQGCVKSTDCRILNHPGISSATCCTTDLCNR